MSEHFEVDVFGFSSLYVLKQYSTVVFHAHHNQKGVRIFDILLPFSRQTWFLQMCVFVTGFAAAAAAVIISLAGLGYVYTYLVLIEKWRYNARFNEIAGESHTS